MSVFKMSLVYEALYIPVLIGWVQLPEDKGSIVNIIEGFAVLMKMQVR